MYGTQSKNLKKINKIYLCWSFWWAWLPEAHCTYRR